MNYKIINDEVEFKKFIDWLPELEEGEQFYYCLFARSKYDKTGTLKSDKSQLARGVATKDRLFGKISKLETKLNSYEINGTIIPENTLALYIHPNPRSMKKASIRTMQMLLDNISKERYQNPKSVSLNALQVSKSRTVYVDFDMDISNNHYDNHIKDICKESLGSIGYNILKTRGGFHILVEPKKIEEGFKNSWHQNITKNYNIDQSGDLLLPVPGCVQGDFIPYFI